jgi:acetyl esterase/lipase
MRLADYPAQEPLSEAGQKYGAECWARSAGIEGEEFAYGEDPYQRLVVWRARPPGAPALLFWHGGGWTSGYKEWLGFMAPAFTSHGVTFVSAGYRLAPQHVFPAGLDDCRAALAWVRGQVTEDVFVGGHSAGGHYAALIAGDRGANAVKGCLSISGVYEFGEGSGLPMRPRFLGPDPASERRASPRYNLVAPLPPFLIAWGTSDFPHLVPQAERFVAALRDAGAEVESIAMEGRTHFTASFAGGEVDGPWVPRALAFIRRAMA